MPKLLNTKKIKGSEAWFKASATRVNKVNQREGQEPNNDGPSWLKFNQLEDGSAELRIYGQITPYAWYDDEVSASQIYDQLKGIDSDIIHVRINSPGGSVFDGTAIYNLLKEKDAKIITHIDGTAASIASIIAMAGDEVHISEAANLMVHKPWTYTAGDADELRKEAEVLDVLQKGLAAVYIRKTGLPEDEINDLINAETWLIGKDAVEKGFADSLIEEEKTEPNNKTPKEPKAKKTEPKTPNNSQRSSSGEPNNEQNSTSVMELRQRLNEHAL